MTPVPFASYRFSTAGRLPHDAFEQYRSIFAAGADAVRHSATFEAELAGYEFTRMVVHRRRLAGIRHIRDTALVRRADFSHFTLTLCLGGSVAAVVDGNERRLHAGEILLSDMTRPSVIQTSGAETITAAVAREIMEAAGGEPHRFNALILRREQAAPLARYLEALTLPTQPDTPDWLPEEEVADRLRDILATRTAAQRRARARRLLSAHRIIEAQLGDPAFDASDLADALRMSRATLYRLFEPLGGVAAHLLDRRLTLLRRLLAETGGASALSPLVARAGLVSDSHASRVFLQRFGERPGRFATRNRDISDVQRAARAMATWPGLLA